MMPGVIVITGWDSWPFLGFGDWVGGPQGSYLHVIYWPDEEGQNPIRINTQIWDLLNHRGGFVGGPPLPQATPKPRVYASQQLVAVALLAAQPFPFPLRG